MNIDHTTIAVRERSLPELYDLALLVLRRHAWPLLLLALIGCGPFALLNWLMLAGAPDERAWASWYPLLLLLAIEGPLATAPLSAYLGSALFDHQPRMRDALRQALAQSGKLLLFGLWRGVLALFPMLLVFYPPHAVEVCVLERQGMRATWKRANALRAVWTAEWSTHLLVAACLMAIGLVVVINTTETVLSVLMHAELIRDDDDWHHYLPGASFAPHLACWLVMTYLAVVRFLTYIDLRTRREGWEVDLALKREARRLEPGR